MLQDILNKKKWQEAVNADVFKKSPAPLLFFSDDPNFEKEFSDFLENTRIAHVFDRYEEQIKELYYLRNPMLEEDSEEGNKGFGAFLESVTNGKKLHSCGTWVFYPWTGNLVHFLEKELYQELRTARNKLLLTHDEQEKFRNFVPAICGMSIGNSVTLSLAYSGGCETMKLADPDVFSGSNLNRVRVPAQYIGVKKVYVAAQQIYELNPYANLILYDSGVTADNLKEFISGQTKADIVVDLMDNLQMKLFLRLAARALKVPLVMTTDNGDNAIVDINRFDLRSDEPPFGSLPTFTIDQVVEMVKKKPSLRLKAHERVAFASRIVGPENIVTRMQESLMAVGKTLASWPQLAIAAFAGGAILAYVIKKIALGETVKSGKVHISFDEMLLENYHTEDRKLHRSNKTEEFTQYLESIQFELSLKDLLGF